MPHHPKIKTLENPSPKWRQTARYFHNPGQQPSSGVAGGETMAATDEFADLERARELLDHATRLQYEAKHLIMAAITKRPSPQGKFNLYALSSASNFAHHMLVKMSH